MAENPQTNMDGDNHNNPDGEGQPLVEIQCKAKWFGKIRRCNRKSIKQKEKEFLFSAVVSFVTLIIFSGLRIRDQVNGPKPYSSEIVMLISEVRWLHACVHFPVTLLQGHRSHSDIQRFGFDHRVAGFCLYYSFHSIFFMRSIEIYIYCLALLLDAVYCSVDFADIEDKSPLTWARQGVNWAGFLIPSCLGYCAIRKWKDPHLYIEEVKGKEDGTYENLERLLNFNSLLVLDLHLQISNVVFMWTDRQLDPEDITGLVLGLLATIVFFILGKLSMRKEEPIGTFLFTSLGTFPLFFLVYKAVEQRDGIANRVYLDCVSLAFGLASVIIRLVILALTYRVVTNYGKGLAQIIKGCAPKHDN